ncbi:hypothetical protein [Lysinibacillus piscis]|uniref:hypothetical protein n=1 Tax=Lysinibacillus piscis TaxID=2518931 RepID=UPI002232A1DE|nr:hypothetical protein [Lysinibacillus sp. KH24]
MKNELIRLVDGSKNEIQKKHLEIIEMVLQIDDPIVLQKLLVITHTLATLDENLLDLFLNALPFEDESSLDVVYAVSILFNHIHDDKMYVILNTLGITNDRHLGILKHYTSEMLI